MTILPSASWRVLSIAASLVTALVVGSAGTAAGQALVNEAQLIPLQLPEQFNGMGTAVAMSGTTAVVGAPYGGLGSGATAHVYVWNGATWAPQATLTPSTPDDDQFGLAVAIQGDTILVAATYSGQVPFDFGAVYVFERTGTVWTEKAKLQANTDFTGTTYFGVSIALDGDTAVVGDQGNSDAGRLLVYSRVNGLWDVANPVTIESVNPADGSHFGSSVAIQGDIIATGAPTDTVLNSPIGSVQIFKRINGAWTAFGALITNELPANGGFGARVAIENELIIVGAPYQNTNKGAVYVFHQNNNGAWSSLPQFWTKLLPQNPHADDYFGSALSISNAVVLVGAAGRANFRGAVYGYSDLTGTSHGKKNLASDGIAGDSFGWSVAIVESRAVVGATIKDVAGVAYAYDVQLPTPRLHWVFTLWPYKYIYMGCPILLVADTAATIKMDLGREHLRAAIGTAPRNGTLRFASANTLQYRPNRGFTGQDVFTVRLTDRKGNVLEKTANVTVVARARAR